MSCVFVFLLVAVYSGLLSLNVQFSILFSFIDKESIIWPFLAVFPMNVVFVISHSPSIADPFDAYAFFSVMFLILNSGFLLWNIPVFPFAFIVCPFPINVIGLSIFSGVISLSVVSLYSISYLKLIILLPLFIKLLRYLKLCFVRVVSVLFFVVLLFLGVVLFALIFILLRVMLLVVYFSFPWYFIVMSYVPSFLMFVWISALPFSISLLQQ